MLIGRGQSRAIARASLTVIGWILSQPRARTRPWCLERARPGVSILQTAHHLHSTAYCVLSCHFNVAVACTSALARGRLLCGDLWNLPKAGKGAIFAECHNTTSLPVLEVNQASVLRPLCCWLCMMPSSPRLIILALCSVVPVWFPLTSGFDCTQANHH